MSNAAGLIGLPKNVPLLLCSLFAKRFAKRFAVLLVAIAASMPLQAQPDTAAADNSAAFTRLADRLASEYQITSADKSLELSGRSVLTWTNPLVGEIYGGVYVWTDAGRPAAIASIYKWYRPHTHRTHEFQSLTTGPIAAKGVGKRDWRTQEAGVVWKPIPGAPAVAASPTARLVQMRGLAKRFAVEMTEKDETVTRLRLLSQPLLRYRSPANSVQDGALFAHAKATDPESVLLIEAQDGQGSSSYHYALARSNFLPLRASYQGAQVWEVPRIKSSRIYAARGAYAKFQFDDE